MFSFIIVSKQGNMFSPSLIMKLILNSHIKNYTLNIQYLEVNDITENIYIVSSLQYGFLILKNSIINGKFQIIMFYINV